MKSYYNYKAKDVLEEFNTTKNGISSQEAEKRLKENGANKLPEAKKKNWFQKFLMQFTDILIIVLLISAVVSAVLGEFIDSIIIFIVVLINAVIGVVQESKAENAMQSLLNLTKPHAKVLRNGKPTTILTEELVVGDIVLLEAGDVVPADLRIIECSSLKTIESSLTGESTDVEKTNAELPDQDLPLGDQANMAFMGTTVSYGNGAGVVVATGVNTEMGKIASYVAVNTQEKTLLQKRIDKTSKILSVIIIILSIVIFAVGLIRNPQNFVECFMIAVSIAVCAVPEGLPTGITITMSLGVKNMSKRKAIVKKLSAVESLGSTQIICSDKTGTLTLNKMTVKEHFVMGEQNEFDWLLKIMTLCNNTKFVENNGQVSMIGDPTETALVEYAKQFNQNKEQMENEFVRINEIPFDSNRKLMTTINAINGKNYALTKGGVDILLARCKYVLENGEKVELTESIKQHIMQVAKDFGHKALRVLGYAQKQVEDVNIVSSEETENNLTFVGLTGMIDPPREEVKPAIQTCKNAGIAVIMITGDHKDTAFAIAKEIGIAENENQVLSGKEIDSLSEQELVKKIDNVRVFARVNPEHKVKIVSALKKHDYIVAMTGDGVNDAPSIKQADIGIGMGITGTDVTKQVADIILTDDNFSTIVGAVEEGRRIYSNINKIIIFLLSTCVAEIMLMFSVITILGLDLFSAPVILFINIISDTFPALALGVEKAERGIMNKKPINQRNSLFSGLNGLNILLVGFFQGLILLLTFIVGTFVLKLDSKVVSSICFITLAFLELFHSYNMRDMHNSLLSSNPFANKFINYAFVVSAFFTIAFIALLPTSVLSAIGLAPLSFVQYAVAIAIAFLIVPIYEVFKCFVRLFNKKHKDNQV